jgi:hypothetical protein
MSNRYNVVNIWYLHSKIVHEIHIEESFDDIANTLKMTILFDKWNIKMIRIIQYPEAGIGVFTIFVFVFGVTYNWTPWDDGVSEKQIFSKQTWLWQKLKFFCKQIFFWRNVTLIRFIMEYNWHILVFMGYLYVVIFSMCFYRRTEVKKMKK